MAEEGTECWNRLGQSSDRVTVSVRALADLTEVFYAEARIKCSAIATIQRQLHHVKGCSVQSFKEQKRSSGDFASDHQSFRHCDRAFISPLFS